jgi:hypothetical protein
VSVAPGRGRSVAISGELDLEVDELAEGHPGLRVGAAVFLLQELRQRGDWADDRGRFT